MTLLTLTCVHLDAATCTWTGGGGDNNWTTGTNWGGTAPVANDDVVFAGSTRLSPNNNNTAGTIFHSLTFNAGAGNYVLAGNAITLSAGATALASNATSGTMTVNIALTFSASAPTITSTAGGTLSIGGTINNGGLLLTIADSGPTTLGGIISGNGGLSTSGTGVLILSAGNIYIGATTVSSGTLEVTGSTASGSAVTVTSGGTLIGTGTVNGSVTVNSGGTLEAGTGGTTTGTLATGAVSMNASSTYASNLNGTGPVTGLISAPGQTVSVAGTLNVPNLSNATYGNVFTIISAGTVTGTFTGLPNTSVLVTQGTAFEVIYTATTVTLTDVGPAGTPNYFDVNGTTAGFGSPSGTYNQSGANWSTVSAGTGTSAAFATNAEMFFGASSSDFSGSTFTVNLNSVQFDGIIINSSGASITLNGTANAYLNTSQVWYVPAGSTLTEDNTWNGAASGININSQALTLAGGGTITFASGVGYNGQGAVPITENGNGMIVNLMAVGSSTIKSESSYLLIRGTLNFASAAAANAFNGMRSGQSATLNLSGGIIDNTSGSAMTLNLYQGTYVLGGSFSFTGSNSLNFGTAAVALTTTPTVTVAANTLTIGGIISGSSGLTTAGSGTLALSGVNTYTGATSVSAGKLIVASGGGLSHTAINVSSGATFSPNPGSGSISLGATGAGTVGATLTLNSGSTFDMTDAATGTCNLSENTSFVGTALTINGATLDFDLSNGGSDVLAVSKSATVSGTNSIGITCLGSSLTAGAYNVITASSGLSGGSWQLSSGGATQIVSMGGNTYTLTLSSSATAVTVTVANAVANIWNGGTSIDWNNLANWSLNRVPLSTDTVQIGNGSGSNDTTPSVTVTGGTCAGAMFLNTASTVGAGTGSLTIGANGIYLGVTGSIIACPVILGANQTWNFNSYAMTVSGALSGTSSLNKSGSGILTLSGANNNTGTMTVMAGELLIASAGSLANTAVSVSNGATISINPGGGTVDLGTNGGGAAGATLTLNSGSTFDMLDGTIGTCNLYQEGSFSGTVLTLSGATLNFDINSSGADTLAATNNAAVIGTNSIGITGVGSSLTIGGIYNVITAAGGLTSGGTWQFTGGGTTQTLTVGANAYILTLSSSSTAVTVTVTANGVDIWNGGTSTDWNNGANWSLGLVPTALHNVQIGNGSGTNSTAPSVTVAGGLCNSITFLSNASAITAGTGTLTVGAGGIIASVTNSSIACPVALATSQTWNTNSNTLSVSGAISGAYNLTVAGSGTLSLSSTSSTYTGATIITGGILTVSTLANGGSASGIGAATNVATNLVINGGTLQYTGSGATTDHLFSIGSSGGSVDASGSGAVNFTNTGAVGLNSQTGSRALTLTGTSTAANSFACVIADSTSATSLTKNAAGTWVLTGISTFSGGTTVAAGILCGTGTLTSTITMNSGGTLEPGDGPATTGTLTTTAVVMNASSTYAVNLNGIGSAASLLSAPGQTVTVAGTLTVPSLANGVYGSVFTIISAGAISGTFSGLANTGILIASGTAFQIQYTSTTVTLTDVGSASALSYFDINGTTSGFGSPSGSYNQGDANWNVSPAGTSATASFPTSNQMVFGASGSDFAGETFTVNLNAGAWTGLFINSTSANITLTGTNNAYLALSQVWYVAAGSTLTEDATFNSIGLNVNSQGVTLSGGGTINFATPIGYNGSTAITENGIGLTVNLLAAGSTASNQSGFVLDTGALNFANAAGANAYGGLHSGSTVILSGGTIDNTSGSSMTLGLNLGTYVFGGSFTFNGSNSLNLGTAAVSLTTTPTVTVTTNSLTIGGIISGSGNGLTKSGSGTLTFTGANTYTGATTVSVGTLALTSGSLSNTIISVASSATLAATPGSGTVNTGTTGAGSAGATLTLNSGSIYNMTDGATGTCNLQQNTSFAGTALTISGATLNFDLSSSAADKLACTGVASVSGTNTITITGLGSSLTLGSSYNLITASSGLNGGTWQFGGGGTNESLMVGGTTYYLSLSSTATALTLSVLNSPTVSTITPSAGPQVGGTSVTITGLNFVSGATVLIGGVSATSVVFNSATSLSAMTPAKSPGLANVTVTNPSTQSGTLSNGFTFYGTLTLAANTGITVASGCAVTIETTSLQVSSTGQADSLLTYVLTTAPAHGAVRTCILGNPAAIVTSGTFTQADIDNDLISYEHGDITASSDSFVFTVSDSVGQTIGSTTVSITVAGTGLANGLQAYWPMEQTTGTSLTDIAGSYSAPLSGTIAWSSGQNFPYALSFDGTSTYASVPAGMANFTGGLTVSVWAKPTAAANNARFIDFSNGAASDNIILWRGGTGTGLYATIFQGSSPTSVTGSVLTLNTWQHLVWTMDNSGVSRLYKNGVFQGSGTITLPNNLTRSSNFIGMSNFGGDALYAGLMDEMRIYNRYCTPGEVTLLSQQAAPVISNLASTGTFIEYGSSIALTASSAAVSDADCLYFSGGSLSIVNSNSSATVNDALSIATTGGITTSGSTVSYSGNAFATINLTSNGAAGANLLMAFNTRYATPTAVAALINALTFSTSAHPALTTTRVFTVQVSDATFNSLPLTISMSIDAVPVITARQTLDANSNGHLDGIIITTNVALNNALGGLTATVAGYAVTGYSAGPASNQFTILMTELPAFDTGATPVVKVTANTTLAGASGTGGQLMQVDGSGVVATDAAVPILISSTWSAGSTSGGVGAGNTLNLAFSETVTAAGLTVAGLGLPVTGDSLSTTTIANQTTNVVSMTLAGTPQLTPGGLYLSGTVIVGSPSGIYLTSAAAAALTDQVGLNPAAGIANTALDIGPSASSISIVWSGSIPDPQIWPLGTITLGATANTHGVLTLLPQNVGNCTVNLTIETSSTGPSGTWSAGSSAGANTFLMKADNSGASAGAPTNPADYALTLTTSNQALFNAMLSGTSSTFALYFQAPTSISSGSAVQQTIGITITASLP